MRGVWGWNLFDHFTSFEPQFFAKHFRAIFMKPDHAFGDHQSCWLVGLLAEDRDPSTYQSRIGFSVLAFKNRRCKTVDKLRRHFFLENGHRNLLELIAVERNQIAIRNDLLFGFGLVLQYVLAYFVFDFQARNLGARSNCKAWK